MKFKYLIYNRNIINSITSFHRNVRKMLRQMTQLMPIGGNTHEAGI